MSRALNPLIYAPFSPVRHIFWSASNQFCALGLKKGLWSQGSQTSEGRTLILQHFEVLSMEANFSWLISVQATCIFKAFVQSSSSSGDSFNVLLVDPCVQKMISRVTTRKLKSVLSLWEDQMNELPVSRLIQPKSEYL